MPEKYSRSRSVYVISIHDETAVFRGRIMEASNESDAASLYMPKQTRQTTYSTIMCWSATCWRLSGTLCMGVTGQSNTIVRRSPFLLNRPFAATIKCGQQTSATGGTAGMLDSMLACNCVDSRWHSGMLQRRRAVASALGFRSTGLT